MQRLQTSESQKHAEIAFPFHAQKEHWDSWKSVKYVCLDNQLVFGEAFEEHQHLHYVLTTIERHTCSETKPRHIDLSHVI